jgi:hypothetical protein
VSAADREVALAEFNAALLPWRQGDIAQPGVIIVVARRALPLSTLTKELAAAEEADFFTSEEDVERVVVLTQTCDIVRTVSDDDPGARLWVQVAPVVKLAEAQAALARKGRITRFAAVPGSADEFADLDRCTTIEKPVLVQMERVDASPTDQQRAAFGEALARNRGRFAFPDDLEKCLGPFKALMAKRAGKNSQEGRCLDAVAQIRAEPDPDWNSDQIDVTVHFIVDADQLPATDEEIAFPPAEMTVVAAMTDPSKITKMIEDSSPGDVALRLALWSRLAEVWLEGCTPTGCIASVCALVESEAEFSLLRMRGAPLIDFDHLSPEQPLVQ